MWDLIRDIIINLFSDVLSIFVSIPLFVFIVAQVLRSTRRARLIDFFNLSRSRPTMKVFISRHSTTTQIPRIQENELNKSSLLKEVKKLLDLQDSERENQSTGNSSKPFTAVSAVEMIEFFRLKESFEHPLVFDWLPREMKEVLSFNRSAVTGVKVNLEVCPATDEYQKLLQEGTLVFIGGTRSNLGSYYYLFGREDGKARPKRGDHEKEVIELIGSQEAYKCDSTHNLGIIQRFTDSTNRRTIFYLAGTGVQGTASAIAYLRLNWQDLHSSYSNRNFCIIIECARRSDEELSAYLASDLSNKDWRVIKEIDWIAT